MSASPDELLVEWYAFSTQRTLFGVVGWKIAAHQAEDRLAVDLDRGATPEATDADDVRAELLHELDQEVERGPARHQVFDQEHLRARPEQALELRGERDAPLAAREPLGAVDDDRARGMRARHAVREDERARAGGEHDVHGPLREVLG